MAAEPSEQKVLLTGATGFVGRYVLRELISEQFVPICLVRDRNKLRRQIESLNDQEVVAVEGDLASRHALKEAASQADHAIHLVGIILQRGGQTFRGVHYEGTLNVLEACREAGIKRYVHMSALGARPGAVSEYHRTKYLTEEAVRESGLDWTILRPSIIHGPEGEFMELMKRFACGWIPPMMPYFGKGQNQLQPVDVRDVATCFVRALSRQDTIRQTIELGGPKRYSWKQLYQVCKDTIPGSKKWKLRVGQPVWIAKLMAMTVMKVPAPGSLDKLRFDVGQVQMSQEDSICEAGAAEQAFGIKLRDFETELRQYAHQIR